MGYKLALTTSIMGGVEIDQRMAQDIPEKPQSRTLIQPEDFIRDFFP